MRMWLYLSIMARETCPASAMTVESEAWDSASLEIKVWRRSSVTRLDSTQLTYSYDDVARTVTSTAPITASSSVKQIASADGLGRPIKSQTTDGSGISYSISETQYDTLGRPYKTSNPHNSTAQYWTEARFDGMGRQTKAILQDNSQTLFAYSGPAVTITDPAGKQRKMQYDGLGRLQYLWEPDPANGNSLTLQTTYAYTTLDGLSSVAQGAQNRTYSYDALGRLASATTPEAGTVCFGTLSGSTCQANGYDSFDNLLYRTDARGVVTNYLYDSLNRLVGVSYPTVPGGVAAMPNVCKVNGSGTNNANACFTYGTSAASFNNGRLVSIADPSGSETYSYNNLGQSTQLQKIVGGTIYTIGYQYNLAGEATKITYPSGRAVNQNVDAIGRLSSIVGTLNSVNTTYASGFAYNPAFQATGFQYGNNLYASFGFSADRLQLNCLDYATTNRGGACTHDATTKFGLGYSYGSAGSNNGQISGVTDSADNGRSATYSYDALYRLTSAVTTGSTAYPKWGLSETYDRYGNRTAQTVIAGTGPSNSVAVSATTNRITSSGYAYDLSGNMTNDGANTLVYDGENRMTSSTGSGAGTYTFDGNGLRVKKVSGSTTTVYIFSGSKVIAEYDNGAGVTAPSREYMYSGGALLAKIDSSGTKYYHQDQLSNRLVTDSSGNISAQLGHYPLGESWYNSSNDKLAFTTYERDSESGNDYAMARFNASPLGRFLSPDLVAGNIADPQSLNRFSYTHNDPINLVDPSGAFVAPQLYLMMRTAGATSVGSLWNEFTLTENFTSETGEVSHSIGGGPSSDPTDTLYISGFSMLNFIAGGGQTNPCAGKPAPGVFNYTVKPTTPYLDGSKNAVQHIMLQHLNPLMVNKSQYVVPEFQGAGYLGKVGEFQAVIALNAVTFQNPDKTVTTTSNGNYYVYEHTFSAGEVVGYWPFKFVIGGSIGDLRRGGGPTLTNRLLIGKDCFTVRTSHVVP
jgi:RHS repeat-associated protein